MPHLRHRVRWYAVGMSKPVVHFEIGCTDTAKAGEFYGSLFGWGGAQMGPAFMIQTGSERGIQRHLSALGHGPITTPSSTSSGGYRSAPGDIPNYGSFAWFADPEGNT